MNTTVKWLAVSYVVKWSEAEKNMQAIEEGTRELNKCMTKNTIFM